MSAIASKLASIIEPSRVCEWENSDSTDLGLGQKQILAALKPGTVPSCIVYPQTQAELAQVINYAYHNHWGILPCGNGSKLGWGGLVEGINIVVSTQRLNQIIEHAVGDLTITVESGIKFAELQAYLAKSGQFLAIDPSYSQATTIGGIVATGDTGSLRQRYNSVRDMLLGLSFVRTDGEVAKAGGRVVKNVAGYDLMKLFTGSFGSLGIISQVTFRVYPQQEASATVVLTGTDSAIAQANQTLLTSALTPIAVELVSTGLMTNLGISNSIGSIARFQSVTPSVKEQSTRILELGEKLGLEGRLFLDKDESDLWEKLEYEKWAVATGSVVTCKIGVLPSTAVSILNQLDSIAPGKLRSLIHAGKGLGVVSFDLASVEEGKLIQSLQKMRSLCQSQGGFLSILEAPTFVKQQLDVWGYAGNASDLMQKIKQQFDHNNMFSPARFVG